MTTAGINIYAIFLAAVASTLTGFGWYAVFMKKDSVIKKEEIRTETLNEKPKKIFLTSFIANIFSAIALFIILNAFKVGTFFVGFKITLMVWFLLTGLSGIKKVLIDKKSFDNFLLGSGHDFVSMLVSVFVLIYFNLIYS